MTYLKNLEQLKGKPFFGKIIRVEGAPDWDAIRKCAIMAYNWEGKPRMFLKVKGEGFTEIRYTPQLTDLANHLDMLSDRFELVAYIDGEQLTMAVFRE